VDAFSPTFQPFKDFPSNKLTQPFLNEASFGINAITQKMLIAKTRILFIKLI
jgi:hypothetical protein